VKFAKGFGGEMKKSTAIQILRQANCCGDNLNAMARIAREELSKAEAKKFVLHVGYRMADIWDDVHVPIYNAFPELAPKWFNKPAQKKTVAQTKAFIRKWENELQKDHDVHDRERERRIARKSVA
jgi:hypothetical protein